MMFYYRARGLAGKSARRLVMKTRRHWAGRYLLSGDKGRLKAG